MARELILYPADGGQIVLNDRSAGYRVFKGVTGLGVPDPEHITDTSPLVDGEVITDTYEVGRRIQLPMMVFGADNDEFLDRLVALTDALDPRKPAFLELAQANGRRRRIEVVYAGGLSGDEAKDLGGDTTWLRFALRLYAPDPAWFDPTPITLTRAYSTPTAFFPWGPVSGRPFRLSSGAVLGAATLTNPGKLAAYPTWTVTAPGTAVELDNEDTGEELHLSGTLTAPLVIVTEPGQQSITMGGTDWWDKLTGVPVLWELPPGDTNVSLALTGAAAGSSVSCSFFPRYRSAW